MKVLQTFPTRTEGSVKKHWYKVSSVPYSLLSDCPLTFCKDMHYAEFAEDEVCHNSPGSKYIHV